MSVTVASQMLVPVTHTRKVELSISFESKVDKILARLGHDLDGAARTLLRALIQENYHKLYGKSNVSYWRMAELNEEQLILIAQRRRFN